MRLREIIAPIFTSLSKLLIDSQAYVSDLISRLFGSSMFGM